MIRNEVMCQRNLEYVLRRNAVYHRNLERCNTKCVKVSEEIEIRAKQNVIYHRNLERCNTKYVNISEESGIRAKTECSLSQEFRQM